MRAAKCKRNVSHSFISLHFIRSFIEFNCRTSCCDANAECSCSTVSGHYSCVCKPGYYGSGFVDTCQRELITLSHNSWLDLFFFCSQCVQMAHIGKRGICANRVKTSITSFWIRRRPIHRIVCAKPDSRQTNKIAVKYFSVWCCVRPKMGTSSSIQAVALMSWMLPAVLGANLAINWSAAVFDCVRRMARGLASKPNVFVCNHTPLHICAIHFDSQSFVFSENMSATSGSVLWDGNVQKRGLEFSFRLFAEKQHIHGILPQRWSTNHRSDADWHGLQLQMWTRFLDDGITDAQLLAAVQMGWHSDRMQT